jgi:aspartate/methionine/tyrosine aminotransferase
VRAVDQVLAELSVQTDQPYSWLVGEPCFGPPIELVNAFERAAGSPSYAYPPHDGLPRLREVLAAYQREEGQAPEPDQIVITSGAKGGLMALFAALLEPGDELIHPTPCYPSYPAMAARLGARPVAVAERGASFAGWPEAVADHIGPKTRAVVLASPSNPTGATLDAPQATALVELCRNRGIRLICDEAYFDFNIASDREVAAAFDPERKTVVQIRSASKSWALCGWSVGWVAADAALVASVARSHAALRVVATSTGGWFLPVVERFEPDRSRRIEHLRRMVHRGCTPSGSRALAGRGLRSQQLRPHRRYRAF